MRRRRRWTVVEGTPELGVARKGEGLHHDKRALAEGVLAEGGEGKVVPSAEELIALMRGSGA